MRISDWSSDVCSSDLLGGRSLARADVRPQGGDRAQGQAVVPAAPPRADRPRLGAGHGAVVAVDRPRARAGAADDQLKSTGREQAVHTDTKRLSHHNVML